MQDAERGLKRAASLLVLASTMLAALLAAILNDIMVFVLCGIAAYMLLLPSLKARGMRWEYPNIFNLALVCLAYFALVGSWLFWSLHLGSYWSVISQLVAGAMVGGIGFLIAFDLVRTEIEDGHIAPLPVAVFAFSIALSMSALWEVIEFGMDAVLAMHMQGGLAESMADLAAAATGAGAVAITAHSYMKNPRPSLFHQLVKRASSESPGLVARRDEATLLKAAVAKGEGERLEFKASLRTNLKTGEIDKRMEHAVLKSIAAFLNSDGGTLMVGVKDDGTIPGVDIQSFDNMDKLYLHFGNIAAEGLGKETLAFLDSHLVPVDGVTVLEVRCMKATSPVFLKSGPKDEFWIRAGASSIELLGRELLVYVQNRFR